MTKQDLNKLLDSIESDLTATYDPKEAKNLTQILLEHVTSISKIDLITKSEFQIPKSQLELIKQSTLLLNEGKPIQHLIGSTHFYDNDFIVNNNVLIPRPETEELVDLCIKSLPPNKKVNILDLCTGSGCISISLDLALPNSKVSAIEYSHDAISVALGNQNRLNSSVNFVEADIFNFQNDEEFDIIISNPPYVMDSEKSNMHLNVLNHEPHMALFVKDHEPLKFYKRIALIAKQQLKSDGIIFLEINESLGSETADLFSGNYKYVSVVKDLFGKDRFVVASNSYSLE